MTHLQQALQRALADPRTMASFDRLDTHAQSGKFDLDAAMRLMLNNARDHTPYTPSHVRQTLARALMSHWQSRDTLDTPGVTRYIKRHGTHATTYTPE